MRGIIALNSTYVIKIRDYLRISNKRVRLDKVCANALVAGWSRAMDVVLAAPVAIRAVGGYGGGNCSGRQSVGYGRGEGCEAAAMQPCRGLHVSMHILSN